MSIFTANLPPIAAPTLVIDADAMAANLDFLRTSASGIPIRVASKSVRVRGIVEWALQQDGVAGVLCYSAAEAVWLVRHGCTDVLVAYPTVDVAVLDEVAADEALRSQIAFMVDDAAHVEMAAQAARRVGGSLRLAMDVDCSLRVRTMVLGVHRSSVWDVEGAGALADLIARTSGMELVGAMFYEAQVAGAPDASPVHRLVKKRTMQKLATYRREVVQRISRDHDLEFVNGGGTGSVGWTRQDETVTDIAAGSGLFTPTSFDRYDDLGTRPACWFVTPVVRKPSAEVATVFSGGYAASGPAGASRVPRPVHPSGLKFFANEGAGEVQTPLHGSAARSLAVGDLVWFRHAKAGEACERFNEVLLVRDGEVVETLPTYRGEGKNFG